MPGFQGTIGGPLGDLIGPKGEYSSISSTAIGSAFSAAMSPILHSASQLIAIAANRVNPILIPSLEQFVKLWHGDNINNAVLNRFARLHGVDIGIGEQTASSTQPIWRMYVDKSRPIPPLEMFRKWLRQGRIEPNAYYEAAQRHGLGSWAMHGCGGNTFRDLIKTDYENLPAATLLANYLIDPSVGEDIRKRLAMLGYSPDSIDMIFAAMRIMPGMSDAIELYRRKMIDRPQLDNIMFGHGITSGFDRQNLFEMAKVMPDQSLLVSVAGQQLWDNAKAARWGLDAEMPRQLELWASRTGMSYGSEVFEADQSQYRGVNWPNMLWRGHWKMPSIALLGEWIHRFRGDVNDQDTWTDPTYRPITDEEKADIWQANGVPPEMRRHYERLLWQPMSVRHIRIVYAREMVPQLDDNGRFIYDANGNPVMGRHPRKWLQERLMATGITEQDANSISRAYKQDAEERDALPALRQKRHYNDKYLLQVQEAYRVGAATREQAQGQLTSKGIPDDVAQTITGTIDLELYSGVIKAIVRRAKSDYLSGRTNAAGAHDRMTSAGVQPARATLYIQAWAAENGEGRKHLSTEKVLRALRKGFISEAEAIARMDNIGWARPDELIMLAEVEADVLKDTVAAQKAANMASEKQAAALARLLEKNEKAKEKIITGIRRTASPATIMNWVRDGIWSIPEATSRLKLLQFDDATIAAMLAEARATAAGKNVSDADRAARTRGNLSKLFPPQKIEKWLRDGTWTIAQAADMLAKQGFTPEAIQARIDDFTATSLGGQAGS